MVFLSLLKLGLRLGSGVVFITCVNYYVHFPSP